MDIWLSNFKVCSFKHFSEFTGINGCANVDASKAKQKVRSNARDTHVMGTHTFWGLRKGCMQSYPCFHRMF
uniref:Uncharacterized protein n=1 Tax=Rhizophora mucronata TaxID=61149 RepID=A0A2P2NTE4_RHIMU